MPAEKPLLRDDDALPVRAPGGRRLVGAGTIRRAIVIAEALFSRGGVAPAPTRLDRLAVDLEDLLARSGARTRWALSALVWLVSFLAPLLSLRPGGLAALPIAERVATLARLEARFGEPLLAVKAMLCLLYYEQVDVAREVGFDGACLVERPRGTGGGPC